MCEIEDRGMTDARRPSLNYPGRKSIETKAIFSAPSCVSARAFYERRELFGRQRTIDVATTFRLLRRQIIATQEHFPRELQSLIPRWGGHAFAQTYKTAT